MQHQQRVREQGGKEKYILRSKQKSIEEEGKKKKEKRNVTTVSEAIKLIDPEVAVEEATE